MIQDMIKHTYSDKPCKMFYKNHHTNRTLINSLDMTEIRQSSYKQATQRGDLSVINVMNAN